MSKEGRIEQILEAVVRLEIERGHLQWGIMDIARKGQVSRPLIYHYFGSSKSQIAEAAIQYLLKLLDRQRPVKNYWADEFAESILATKRTIARFPGLQGYYSTMRDHPSAIGEMIRHEENLYLVKLESYFPGITDEQKRALQIMLWNLSLSSELGEEATRSGLELIEKSMCSP